MRWLIRTRKPASVALDFCKATLAGYDTLGLKSIRIEPGRPGFGVYGFCTLDDSDFLSCYYIQLHIPGPFPHKVYTREPANTEPSSTIIVSSRNVKRSVTCLRSRTEGLIWLFGHEFFHYLGFTNQVDLVNNEYNADHFANDLLSTFRKC
jgi:hypothetical protein